MPVCSLFASSCQHPLNVTVSRCFLGAPSPVLTTKNPLLLRPVVPQSRHIWPYRTAYRIDGTAHFALFDPPTYWRPFSIVGCCHLMMACFAGRSWSLPIAADCFWPLATVDKPWGLFTFVWDRWRSLGILGDTSDNWHLSVVVRNRWFPLAIVGGRWVSLAVALDRWWSASVVVDHFQLFRSFFLVRVFFIVVDPFLYDIVGDRFRPLLIVFCRCRCTRSLTIVFECWWSFAAIVFNRFWSLAIVLVVGGPLWSLPLYVILGDRSWLLLVVSHR